MPTVDFLPYSTGGGANVESQASYVADPTTVTGQVTGLARSSVFNKIWRQSGFIAAAIANVVSQVLVVDVLDDGNLSGLITKIKNTITTLAWTNPVLTGVTAAPTPSKSDNSTKIATTAWFSSRRFIGAQHNVAAAGNGSEAHGLGAVPSIVYSQLICIASIGIFTTGQVITSISSARNSDSGLFVFADATNINWQIGSDGITLIDGSGTTFEITGSANFQLRMVAVL